MGSRGAQARGGTRGALAGAGAHLEGAGRPMFRIYDLRLASSSRLASAMARILESEAVASCAVEPELLRVRFIARPQRADTIVRQIYAEGGLTWCSRHEWRPLRGEEVAALE
jgi:hypothetical protein